MTNNKFKFIKTRDGYLVEHNGEQIGSVLRKTYMGGRRMSGGRVYVNGPTEKVIWTASTGDTYDTRQRAAESIVFRLELEKSAKMRAAQ